MSSEIRRTSADDPGETTTAPSPSDNQAIHFPYQELTRQELDDLPDYDGAVPPPLEGADPGNEDPGEPAETTGLGEGYHSPEEYRAWLREHRAGYGPDAGHGHDAAGESSADAPGETETPGSEYDGWADDVDGSPAPADEPGDPEGTEQARPGTRSVADAGQQSQREDAQEQKPKDQLPDVNVSPTADTSPDASRDFSSDEQRWAAIEQRMKASLDSMKADYDAKVEGLKAEYEAKLSSNEARIDELEAKLAQQDHSARPDDSPDGDDQPEPTNTSDTVRREERSEGANAGGDPGDDAAESDRDDIERIFTGESGREGHKVERTKRPLFTVENVGIAGATATLGQSIAEIFGSVPPEISVGGAVVGFIGAAMALPQVKRFFDKWKDRDDG